MLRPRLTLSAFALCAACSIYDPSLLDGLSSGGSAGRAGSGGAGVAGEGGSSGNGNAGTSAGVSGAGGASGGGIGSDASNDGDSSSGKGGGIGVDVTNDADGRGGAGGVDGSGGASIDDSGRDGASGDSGASGTGGAAGSGGTGVDAGDADGDATDVAGGTDGGDGGDGRTTCASYPVSGKPSWVVTASHTSLGNSQESDPLYNPPSHAHDGILGERWSTGKPQSGNEWLQIDFGRSVAISQATLQLGSSTSDHPRGYAVRVSEMPLDFAAPILVSGAGQASVDTVIVFGVPVVGRYLLIAQTGSASSWWSVAEVNVACTD